MSKEGHQNHNIKDGHIGFWGAFSALFVFTTAKAFLAVPERMVKGGETAAWIVPLASGIVSILWIWPLLTVLKAYPGNNIVQITRRLAGRFVTVVFGIIAGVFFIGFTSSFASELAHAISAVILPDTPLSLVEFLIFGVALFVAFHGLEVMSRLMTITAAVLVVGIPFLAVVSANHWNLDSIFPLLGPGLMNLSKTIVVRQASHFELFSIAALAAFVREKEEVSKSAWWALGVGSFTLCLSVLTSQMMFPYPSLATTSVPFLRVARIIYINRFFQRFDILFVLMWLTAGVLSVTLGIWFNSYGLATTFSLEGYKLLLIPVAVLTAIGAHFIPDPGTAIIIEYDLVRPYGVILLYAWPYLTLILHLLRRKKSAKHQGELK